MGDEGRDEERRSIPTGAAVCGLYCGACHIYIASREDPITLGLLAGRFGQTEAETYCEGCRSARRTKYCQTCVLQACAARRGIDFCSECADFSCEDLKSFQAGRPHRAGLFADLRRIAEIGPEAWVVETAAHYSCPDCGTINSAYHLRCRKCGRDPSSTFIVEHEEEIVAYLAKG